MVKWLDEIRVADRPSDNFYHFNDNRILPPEVDAERAAAEGWWYKQEYIFNELNINSAIGSPAHGETLRLQRSANPQPYTLRGYAYTGGGRPVTRVEVSLDGGASWQLADLAQQAPPTRYGRHWCWVFWTLAIDARALLLASTISCRAWDAGNNTQPRHITWNVMGMGNNCHFTVRLHPEVNADGSVTMRFEHPTEPGALKGGWMGNTAGGWSPDVPPQPLALISGAPAAVMPAPTPAPPAAQAAHSSLRRYTLAEVAQHATEEDCWIVVSGKVYDTTKFNKSHPGGGSSIFINAGTDTTEEFEAIHSKRAWGMLDEWLIGELGDASDDAVAPPATPAPVAEHMPLPRVWSGPVALDPRKRLACPLIAREEVSHDSRLLRFALPSPSHVLGLPVGQHIFVAATVDNRLVMRAYTPTSRIDACGSFDLLVKVYRAGSDPEFPLGGAMSQHLDQLTLGQTIEIKGPLGHIEYVGQGAFQLGKARTQARRVALLAAGTGITPMYQLLVASLGDSSDSTCWWLLYANRTEADILLRNELEALAAAHPARFTLVHTLSRPPVLPGAWGGAVGRVSAELVCKTLPVGGTVAEDDMPSIAFLCGPGGFQDASYRHLFAHGYADERVLTF